MGLPSINIVFKTKGVTAIKRSARGIVAVIIKDGTQDGEPLQVLNSVTDVDFSKFTERNFEYLKLIFEGSPSKVIVARIGEEEADLAPTLKTLKNLKWNYLTFPAIDEASKTLLSAWIKECREQHKKTFKAVLPSCPADHEGIINYTTGPVTSTLGKNEFTAAEYCARIAGVLAGLPLTRSCTYYQLTDITSADTPNDPDTLINKGELVIVFDGAKYKIGRGVNSLVTFTASKGRDLSKIKIMEGVDLYNDDIRDTYEESYVGKYINDYDNKQAFVAAILAYQKALQPNVLDQSYDHTAAVDLEAQSAYLESQGISTEGMSEMEIAKANTGSRVFAATNIKFVDAMEDLDLTANM